MLDDKALVARITTQDDQRAFAELVKRYQSMIRQFLRRLTAGDHAIADDIAQETFLQVYQKLHTFRGEGSLGGWVHRIAYHRFLNHCRKVSRLNEVYDDSHITLLATQDSIEADLLAEKLMGFLNIDERLVITLHISEGMTHSEIADVIDKPLGTIKSLIQRGKRKLCQIMAAEGQVA